MRGARKEEKTADARRQALGLPEHIKLLPASRGDELRAAAQHFGGHYDAAWKHSRRAVAQESIFSAGAVAAATAARQKKRPAPGGGGGRGSTAAGAAGAAAGRGPSGSSGGASRSLQRRLAANVKLRLTDPKV